ncbi:MAG: ferritin family protein [Chloroflexota bacterium]
MAKNEIPEALQIAIKMEIDGREYYLKVSQRSSNELGKKLLRSLADEENIHRQQFEKIYQAIRDKKGWPAVSYHSDKGKKLDTIFAQASSKIDPKVKVSPAELDAVETAVGMENKSYDFYKSQSKTAASDAEKSFYEALAAQESEHHRVLLDYSEYLKDPAAWFVNKERPSLDGG